MTPADLLAALFPSGHTVVVGPDNIMSGTALATGGTEVAVLGIANATPLSPEIAITLAGQILDILRADDRKPIVLLIDTASQRMTRRDEMLGLYEYLGHLAKVITLAGARGHRTVGILYGTAAAGAFIATTLATQTLIAVDGAHPSVMDLPSIARVTKLPLETLEEKARTTPIFAPGVAPLAATGAVAEIWTAANGDLSHRLATVLAAIPPADDRDQLGAARGGRKLAHDVAEKVAASFAGEAG
ncbi:biotin-independent malonate decarboxylase subunit gamma [Gluconacetobacter takamatsuzukensis]|uniref:Biotin-independent malonate decarboxylase subunit gamma n=1 Tax=Gluconacetobacter takamatsuzukensis TaxID=1286190 RepID=A0A7W4KF89_9PROT|nr:biotin-independent malonate decarboxylase subunit gamma [Gluconacetobacter takamatsuzukensis]MBB2205872.1 biotin-independent malonate decarboxylase subunit gamma [Gluconacetobacter takamatsuzukensis]